MNAATTTAKIAPPVAPPVNPPRSWFDNPQFAEVTPLIVSADGRVRGHLASWASCHADSKALGSPCVHAPHSMTDYKNFHVGALTTADGEEIAVGHIVAGAPHSDPAWNLNATLVHYSHSGWVGADVRVGEDRHGIWVAGALRPDVSPAQLRALKSSPLSGDWRADPHTGALELVAALAVSSPGFSIPRPRALVASSGAIESLLSVGVVEHEDRSAKLRALHLDVMRIRADEVRRAFPDAPPTRRFARRNFAAVAAKLAAHQEKSLIAAITAPGARTVPWSGVIGREGAETGDGRYISPDALSAARFPLPLRWAPADLGGHDGALIIGTIDRVVRGSDGQLVGSGLIDLDSAAGKEAARMMANGTLSGISMDLDAVDNQPMFAQVSQDAPESPPVMVTKSARLRGATLVAIPAFDEARVALDSGQDAGGLAEPSLPDDQSQDCGCEGPLDTVSAPAVPPPAEPDSSPVGAGTLPGIEQHPDIDAMRTLATRARALRAS